jgi:hypothetical protein
MKLRSVLAFCFMMVSAFVVYGIYTAVQPRVITCSFEGAFSPQLKKRCCTLITPQFLKKQSRAAALQAIKDTVIGLEGCSIQNKGFQHVHVALTGIRPFVNMNDSLVLTTAGTTVPASEFDKDLLARLPLVHVEDPSITNPDTIAQFDAFMKALPHDFFEQMVIVWHDKTAIYLLDLNDPQKIIVAQHATRFTDAVRAIITQLQQQISEEPKKKGRGVRKKIVDVRVKGQIVIRNMQGGEYESTSWEKYYNRH